jgi:hypothetical protein
LLRERLSKARPGDAFLGEELGQLGASERVWILDPIDGTGFFSRRDPNWRIQIALELQGTTEVAVVASPALQRCWWATRGGGAFESSWLRKASKTTRLAVSSTSTLADAVLDALDDESRARLPPSAAPAPASDRIAQHAAARCPAPGGAGSRRARCLLGRALLHAGPRAMGSPRRGGWWSLHRSNRRANDRGGGCTRTPSCTNSCSHA